MNIDINAIRMTYDVRKFLQSGNPGEENTPQLGDCFMSTDSGAGQYSKEHMINIEENEKKKKDDCVNTSTLIVSETNVGKQKQCIRI